MRKVENKSNRGQLRISRKFESSCYNFWKDSKNEPIQISKLLDENAVKCLKGSTNSVREIKTNENWYRKLETRTYPLLGRYGSIS